MTPVVFTVMENIPGDPAGDVEADQLPAQLAAQQAQQAAGPPPQANQPSVAAQQINEFWIEEPDLWFERAEAQFRRSRVTDERAKADYLLTALQTQVLKSVRDILADRTAPTPPCTTG